MRKQAHQCPLLVFALRWMEIDPDRQSRWFEMETGKGLLGVLIERQSQQFVYIVTQPATDAFSAVHARRPLVVSMPETPCAWNMLQLPL